MARIWPWTLTPSRLLATRPPLSQQRDCSFEPHGPGQTWLRGSSSITTQTQDKKVGLSPLAALPPPPWPPKCAQGRAVGVHPALEGHSATSLVVPSDPSPLTRCQSPGAGMRPSLSCRFPSKHQAGRREWAGRTPWPQGRAGAAAAHAAPVSILAHTSAAQVPGMDAALQFFVFS